SLWSLRLPLRTALDAVPKGAFYVDELLLNTENYYGKYLKHYMTEFITGENKKTDGLLHQRMQNRRTMNEDN
ncbi:hypothetical protein JQK62_22725, partial [Leptospira santarosai]|nr:hypothetical protein [Leptospira santarosai]